MGVCQHGKLVGPFFEGTSIVLTSNFQLLSGSGSKRYLLLSHDFRSWNANGAPRMAQTLQAYSETLDEDRLEKVVW